MTPTVRGLCLGAALACVVGCSGGATPAPSTLIDGTPARPPPDVLEGVEGPRVATRVRVVAGASLDGRALLATCVSGTLPNGPVVERTGVAGVSVTFIDPGRGAVRACDATEVRRSRPDPWCARAFGLLSGARLRDPRLTITCRDAVGDLVGFAWVQPRGAAAYVVVQQPTHAEIHAVSGKIPVRVTTTDVDLTSSQATFAISEHAKDGRRLRSYDLETQVAG